MENWRIAERMSLKGLNRLRKKAMQAEDASLRG
jgi:hypothetical protein